MRSCLLGVCDLCRALIQKKNGLNHTPERRSNKKGIESQPEFSRRHQRSQKDYSRPKYPIFFLIYVQKFVDKRVSKTDTNGTFNSRNTKNQGITNMIARQSYGSIKTTYREILTISTLQVLCNRTNAMNQNRFCSFRYLQILLPSNLKKAQASSY